MKKICLMLALCIGVLTTSAKVAFLVPAADTDETSMQYEEVDGSEQSPERRAWRWFNDNYVNNGIGQFVSLNDLASLPADIRAMWIYVDRVGFNTDAFDNLFNDAVKANLKTFVNNGGHLFLCKQATRLEKDLVGATNGTSSEIGAGDIIIPDYNDGGYIAAATWGVDFKFFSEEGWGSNLSHPMFVNTSYHNTSYAELIWTDSKKLTNNNCGISTAAMGMNDVFDRDRLAAFQTRNNCKVLGAWANDGNECNDLNNEGCYNGCHYGGVIEFYPHDVRKGTVITMGLAAYSWINNNAGNGWANTQVITQSTLDYLDRLPYANDNTTAMADKLAEDWCFPSNTTSFRTLHPDIEGLAGTYAINNEDIAFIDGSTLKFKSEGTVTLHITLVENRAEQKNWPRGTYHYDRDITFAYANANAAQEAFETDIHADGRTEEEEEEGVEMAMRLHPSVRGMDSLSYTITNHYDGTEGEAVRVTADEVTRLYFTKAGKVLVEGIMNESDIVETWPVGQKNLSRVVEFAFSQPEGPAFAWPAVLDGTLQPGSVISLPATIGGLTPDYTLEGDATIEGNILTIANVDAGSVTIHASVTENDYKLTWPKGTYTFPDKTAMIYKAEVAYLLPSSTDPLSTLEGWYDGEQPEYNAAIWFRDNYINPEQKGCFITIEELPTAFANGIKVVWANVERVGIGIDDGMFTNADIYNNLKAFIQAGGNVLLTKQATYYAYQMGRIGYAPEFTAKEYNAEEVGHVQRSIATKMGTADGVDEAIDMSGHRLYTYILNYDAAKNIYLVGPNCKKTYNYCSWRDFFTDAEKTQKSPNGEIANVRNFESAWDATVFGIRGDVGDYCLSDVIEFNANADWAGRILTIGSAAYQWGTSNNGVEGTNVRTLTSNALSYLLDAPIPERVYTRTVTAGKYGTLCFDYNVAADKIEGADIFELESMDEAETGVLLTQVNNIVAGRPYFFQATANELRLTYSGIGVEAVVGGYHGMHGYIDINGNEDATIDIANDPDNYILYNNELLQVDQDDIKLNSHRAYLKKSEIPAYSGTPAGKPIRRMAFVRTNPTDVETVNENQPQEIYDILGRKVTTPQGAGFYIINGKKVVRL